MSVDPVGLNVMKKRGFKEVGDSLEPEVLSPVVCSILKFFPVETLRTGPRIPKGSSHHFLLWRKTPKAKTGT